MALSFPFMDVVYTITKTEFRLRDQGTFLGLFWTLLNPVLMFVTLYALFNRSGLGGASNSYAQFLLAGLTVWSFFSSATSSIGTALSGRPQYLHGTTVNLSTLVLASLKVALLISLIELLIMSGIVAMFWDIHAAVVFKTSLAMALLCPLVVSAGLLLQGAALLFSDAYRLWQLMLRVGFFVTPVFYSHRELPVTEFLFYANPLVPYLALARGEHGLIEEGSLFVITILAGVACLIFLRLLDIHRAYVTERL